MEHEDESMAVNFMPVAEHLVKDEGFVVLSREIPQPSSRGPRGTSNEGGVELFPPDRGELGASVEDIGEHFTSQCYRPLYTTHIYTNTLVPAVAGWNPWNEQSPLTVL